MRFITITAALLVAFLAFSPAQAETNIWGTSPGNHQFSAVAGSDMATVSWMWTPKPLFSWGFRVSPVLTKAADQKGSRWDTALIGVGVEFPAVALESMFKNLPLEGKIKLGLGADIDPKTQQWYIPITGMVDVKITDDMDFRLSKPLTEINTGESASALDWRIGVVLRW